MAACSSSHVVCSAELEDARRHAWEEMGGPVENSAIAVLHSNSKIRWPRICIFTAWRKAFEIHVQSITSIVSILAGDEGRWSELWTLLSSFGHVASFGGKKEQKNVDFPGRLRLEFVDSEEEPGPSEVAQSLEQKQRPEGRSASSVSTGCLAETSH